MIREDRVGQSEVFARVGNTPEDQKIAQALKNELGNSTDFIATATGLLGNNYDRSRYTGISRFNHTVRSVRSKVDIDRRPPYASQIIGAYDIVSAWKTRKLVGLFDDYGMGKTYTALLAYYGWKAELGEEESRKSKLVFFAENKPLDRAYDDFLDAGVSRTRIFKWENPNKDRESTAQKLKRLQETDADIILCPFTAATQKQFLEALDGGGRGIGQHVVVIDESHELRAVNGELAGRSRTVRELSRKLSERGSRGLLLSATPVVYDTSELNDWSVAWKTATIPVVARASEDYFETPPITTRSYDIQTTLPPIEGEGDVIAFREEAAIVTEWAATTLAPQLLLDPHARILFFSPYVNTDIGMGDASLLTLEAKLRAKGIRSDTLYSQSFNQDTVTASFLQGGQALGVTYPTGANSFTFNAEGLNVYVVLLHPSLNPADIPQAIARADRPKTGIEPVTIIVPSVSRSGQDSILRRKFNRLYESIDISSKVTGNIASWRENVISESVQYVQSGGATEQKSSVSAVIESLAHDLESLSSEDAQKVLAHYASVIAEHGEEGALLSTSQSRNALSERLQPMVDLRHSAAEIYAPVRAVQYITEKILKILPPHSSGYNSGVVIQEVLHALDATSTYFADRPGVRNHIIYSILYGRAEEFASELPRIERAEVDALVVNVTQPLQPEVESTLITEPNPASKVTPKMADMVTVAADVAPKRIQTKKVENLTRLLEYEAFIAQVNASLGEEVADIEAEDGSYYSLTLRNGMFRLENVDEPDVWITVVYNHKTRTITAEYSNRLGEGSSGGRDCNLHIPRLMQDVVLPYFDKGQGLVQAYEVELKGDVLIQFKAAYAETLSNRGLTNPLRSLQAIRSTYDATHIALPLGFSPVAVLGMNSGKGIFDLEITPVVLDSLDGVTAKWIKPRIQASETKEQIKKYPSIKYKGVTVEFETEDQRDKYILKNSKSDYAMSASKRMLWLWSNGYVDGRSYRSRQLRERFPGISDDQIFKRIQSLDSPIKAQKRVVVPFELVPQVYEFLSTREEGDSSPIWIVDSGSLNQEMIDQYEMWLMTYGYINARNWTTPELSSRYGVSIGEISDRLIRQSSEVSNKQKILIPSSLASQVRFKIEVLAAPGILRDKDYSTSDREERLIKEQEDSFPFVIKNGRLRLEPIEGPMEGEWRQIYAALTFITLRDETNAHSGDIYSLSQFDEVRAKAKQKVDIFLMAQGYDEEGRKVAAMDLSQIATETGIAYKQVEHYVVSLRNVIERSAYKGPLSEYGFTLSKSNQVETAARRRLR